VGPQAAAGDPTAMLRPQEPLVDSAVTIILPVHNAEGSLRPLVSRILDLAMTSHRRLTRALVDDGSPDETFEAACELARDFPQVRVFRQPYQGGLGPALDEVRKRLSIDEAIVHDGVGPLNFDELAALLANEPSAAASAAADSFSHEGRGSRRFAAVTALNARLPSRASRAQPAIEIHELPFVEPLPTP
jgi:hypothetical protein